MYPKCFIQDKDFSECLESCDPNNGDTKGWLCESNIKFLNINIYRYWECKGLEALYYQV